MRQRWSLFGPADRPVLLLRPVGMPVLLLLLGAPGLRATAADSTETAPLPGLEVPAGAPDSIGTRAQAGEWVRVRTRIAAGTERDIQATQKISVVSVAESGPVRAVVVAYEAESGGNKGKLTQTYRVGGASPAVPIPAGAEGVELPAEDVTVSGKVLKCTVRERTVSAGPPKLTVRTWSSPRVPLGGTVKIAHNGRTIYELLDFGREKPR